MSGSGATTEMRVSVVVPLYNKGALVLEALRSIQAQTRPADEIIVVDDGSTDDGPARVSRLSDARLRLICQPNGGVSSARNTGIAHATGDLVAFLDADDFYRPGFIEQVVQLARDYPGAGAVATGYERMAADGRVWSAPPHRSIRRRGLVSRFHDAWLRSSFLCSDSIAIRAELLRGDPSLRFPVGERLGEDQDLWFRLAEAGPVAYDPTPLAVYRVGIPGSATDQSAVTDLLPCYRRLQERVVAGRLPPHLQMGARRLVATHYINVAIAQARAGNIEDARGLLAKSITRWRLTYWLRTSFRLGALSRSSGVGGA